MALKRGGKKHRIKKKHPKHSAGELSSLKLKKNLKDNAHETIKNNSFCKKSIYCKFACCWKKDKIISKKKK